MTGSAAWAISKERGLKAGIQASAPHDLRRSWVGDIARVRRRGHRARLAGHASVATTARYDRRDHVIQLKAAAHLTCHTWRLAQAAISVDNLEDYEIV
jgi:integrase/recombinase XerD